MEKLIEEYYNDSNHLPIKLDFEDKETLELDILNLLEKEKENEKYGK